MSDELEYQTIVPRYPELRGRVAVVTGSTRRIGRGIALRLAREGMKVVVNGRNAAAVERMVALLRSVGAAATGIPADMSVPEQAVHLIEQTLRDESRLDLLVNNAASLDRFLFATTTPEQLETSLASNIRGPYLCSLKAVEAMRSQASGVIVNISSVGGLRAHHHGLPYDLTKGAVDAMTRAMAIDCASYGIRVNAVAPGATRGSEEQVDDEARRKQMEEVCARIPLGRFGTALEIAAAVAFLASDEARYITGQVIYVDGGITAQLSPPGQPI